MKRFFAIVICTVLLICMISFCVSAEGDSLVVTEANDTVVENVPTEEGTAAESEILASADKPLFTTEMIKAYVRDHFEEISVLISIVIACIFETKQKRVVEKSIQTSNNNAIVVAEDSKAAINNVIQYKETINNLLLEFRKTEEENKELRDTLDAVHRLLNTEKLACIELADEVAELLVLANIPNSKKDELYSRHLAAVNKLADVEKAEVITNDDGQASK